VGETGRKWWRVEKKKGKGKSQNRAAPEKKKKKKKNTTAKTKVKQKKTKRQTFHSDRSVGRKAAHEVGNGEKGITEKGNQTICTQGIEKENPRQKTGHTGKDWVRIKKEQDGGGGEL